MLLGGGTARHLATCLLLLACYLLTYVFTCSSLSRSPLPSDLSGAAPPRCTGRRCRHVSKGCAATAPRTRAAECRVPTHSGVGSGSARMWDSLRSTRDAVNPARTVVWCKVEVVHPRSQEIRLPSPRVPARLACARCVSYAVWPWRGPWRVGGQLRTLRKNHLSSHPSPDPETPHLHHAPGGTPKVATE